MAFDTTRANRMYIATDELGLFRSDDAGESFRPINEGFCNRHVVSVMSMGTILYASSADGLAAGRIFRYTDVSKNWEKIDSVPSWLGKQILKAVALDQTHLYVLTSKAVLYSSDAGRSWRVQAPPATSKLTDLLVSTLFPKLLVSSSTGIYYADEAGQKWQLASTPQGLSPILSLVALGSHSVAAITRSAVLMSTNGIDYKAVAPPEPDAGIYSLVTTDEGHLLTGTSYGLRKSEDSGATWLPVRGVLEGSTVTAICKHPSRTGVLFASGYGTIFVSVDDGREWAPLTTQGQELPAVRGLILSPGIPGRLFAITRAQGIYALPLDPKLN